MSLPIDPDEQISSGMKMIQSAFEAQSAILTNEIHRLNQQLENKSEKIEELEILSQNLLRDNKHLNQLVEKLTEENSKYKLSSNGQQQPKIESRPQSNYLNYNLKNPYMNTQTSNSLRLNNNKMDNIISSLDDSINKIVRNNATKTIRNSLLNLVPLKRIDNSASRRILNNKTEDTQSERSEFINKSKGLVNTDFFKACRSTLKKIEYSKLIEIVKMSNSRQINKNETYSLIEQLLFGKYNDLFNEFKDIFQFKDHQS